MNETKSGKRSLTDYQRIPEQSRSEVRMKDELFKEVVLLKDIPGKKLKKGDVATIVEHHPSATSEDGYSLEIFNALGDTVAVVTVRESEIETLKAS